MRFTLDITTKFSGQQEALIYDEEQEALGYGKTVAEAVTNALVGLDGIDPDLDIPASYEDQAERLRKL